MRYLAFLAFCSALASASERCIFKRAIDRLDICRAEEVSPQEGHEPWTHQPYCVSATEEDESVPDKRFCVYTNANFNNGSGISVIASPKLATAIAGTAAFKQSKTTAKFGQTQKDDVSYVAKERKRRGIGLFAKRAIQRGETILKDEPTLVVDRNIYKVVQEPVTQVLQWRALAQLPKQSHNSTRNLARLKRGDELDDILQTNGFALTFPADGEPVGLLPLASRINHDCRPNAYYHFNPDTLTHHVWAVRDISPGEEITQSYIFDPEYNYATRTALLEQTWHFDCQCSLCSQPRSLIAASDARLSRISSMRQKLYQAFAGNFANRTTIAEELINLYDEEGLIVPKMELCEVMAFTYWKTGERKRAAELAEIARDWVGWMEGNGSERLKKLDGFLRWSGKRN